VLSVRSYEAMLFQRDQIIQQKKISSKNTQKDKVIYDCLHSEGMKYVDVERAFAKSRQEIRSAESRHQEVLKTQQQSQRKENEKMDIERIRIGLRPLSTRASKRSNDEIDFTEEPVEELTRVKHKSGRIPLITADVESIALEMITTNEFKLGTNGTLEKSSIPFILGKAIQRDKAGLGIGNSDSKLINVSDYVANKFFKKTLEPLSSKHGGKRRNQRDVEAHEDLGNYIAWYLVLSAVLEGTAWLGKVKQDPRLLCNIDAVTMLCNARQNKPIVGIKEMKAWMSKYNRSATVFSKAGDGQLSFNEIYFLNVFGFLLLLIPGKYDYCVYRNRPNCQATFSYCL